MAQRIVIPARLHSSRLPEKVIADIGGKPMVQHAYEQACLAELDSVVIATDDVIVAERCQQFGASVCLTSTEHISGSERIGEVIQRLNYADDDIIVNLQADEPFMPPSNIRQVAMMLQNDKNADMGTLATNISEISELTSSDVVKVVCNHEGMALYFSRAVIPWPRATDQDGLKIGLYLKHIGIYAMRAGAMTKMLASPPAQIELFESLEQLRLLWLGYKIKVEQASNIPPHCIDTAADLANIRTWFEKEGFKHVVL